MSRFYDALREAGRPQAGKLPTDEWEAKGSPTENAPPQETVFENPRVPEPASQIAFAPEPEPAEVTAVEPVLGAGPVVTPEDLLDLALHPQDSAAPKRELAGIKARIAIDKRARVLPHATDSVVLEHYRRLRTKILQQHEIKPFRTVVIASSAPQEGKTVTTLNLGFSFSMLPSFKVLVIDGDLRRGTIGKWLGVGAEQAGFSDLIEGTAALDDVILGSDNTPLRFMVRGKSKISPAELLHSPRLSSHLRRMAEYFDLVLIDSAPLSLVTDAQLLATHCDAVILSARVFQTTRKSLEQSAGELNGFRIIGTVLNGGTRPKAYRRYNEYYTNDKAH
jgi:polysaccharide biosynthesis transport protein